MPTRAEPVRIGPFTGGLNTYSDPAAIADEDVVDLINFEVDLDGSLISRPPFVRTGNTGGGRTNCRILGTYTTPAGVNFIIFSNASGTGFYNINTATFGTITATTIATSMVQYQNKAWLISPPGGADSGSWDGTTWTADATMPKGVSCTVYKERIFVASGSLDTNNPSRVYFSAPANPSSWTGTDFFDVNNGDGQAIIKIYSFSGSVVIFKARSTYVYAYETSPAKGQVQNISATTGLDDVDCLAESENVLYVMANGDAFSISNWNWEQINVKVPFAYTNTRVGSSRTGYSVSAVGNRIIFRYYDTMYVFGTKTRAWTKWLSGFTPDNLIKSPVGVNVATGVETYFADNYLTAGPAANFFYTFQEAYENGRQEQFDCSVRTKTYSMNVPYSFKRLMWWGVDLLAKTRVYATVTPVTWSQPVKWSDLAGKTWADMAGKTWGMPADVTLSVTDAASITNTTSIRMFIRYIKSLRFRQVQFFLKTTIDGSPTTGPFRIYTITAYIANKQLVGKKIN